MKRFFRWAFNSAAVVSAVPCVRASAREALTTQPWPPEDPPAPAVANVVFVTALAAFVALGMALPARRRRYIVAVGVAAGVVLGVWLDTVTTSGPNCGMIGVPVELVLAGGLGTLIRSAVSAVRRRGGADG